MLYCRGNLLGCLALDSQLSSEFVIGQNGFDCLWIEADRRQSFLIVRDGVANLDRGKGRSSGKAPHHEANEAVVAVMDHFEAILGEHLDRGTVRNICEVAIWKFASQQPGQRGLPTMLGESMRSSR